MQKANEAQLENSFNLTMNLVRGWIPAGYEEEDTETQTRTALYSNNAGSKGEQRIPESDRIRQPNKRHLSNMITGQSGRGSFGEEKVKASVASNEVEHDELLVMKKYSSLAKKYTSASTIPAANRQEASSSLYLSRTSSSPLERESKVGKKKSKKSKTSMSDFLKR